MPKLHLKRTPAEEAEHQLRKYRKAARKAKRSLNTHHCDSFPSNDCADHISGSRKRHRHEKSWSDGIDETEHGHNAPQSKTNDFPAHKFKPDFDAILAQLEDDRFRDKLFSAYEDDERLDSLEARLNDFAHVPHRWRSGGDRSEMAGDEEMDPQYMSDESYAEWVRAGMWRRTHAAEFEEQSRQRALKDARRAQKNAAKAETARQEKAAQAIQRRKKQEKESRRWKDAREGYDRRWKDLTGGDVEGETGLRFEDVPWPITPVESKSSKRESRPTDVTVEDLTELAISSFLLPPTSESDGQGRGEIEKKERKERLREAMLRFHPDKFEGRLLRRVREDDRKRVIDGVGQVVRVLNALMVKEHG